MPWTLDEVERRFRNKQRGGDFKAASIDDYLRRFKQGVEMYTKWLADDPTWRPAQRRTASRVGEKVENCGQKKPTRSTVPVPAQTTVVAATAMDSTTHRPGRSSRPDGAVPVPGTPRRHGTDRAPGRPDRQGGGARREVRGVAGLRRAAGDHRRADRLAALVDTMIGVIGGKLGQKLNMTTYFRTEQKANADAPKTYAYTWVDPGTDCASPTARICQIHLNPKGQATSGKNLEGIIAHEVMHCFVFQIVGVVRGYEMPAWLGEGLPAWVGEDITGGTAVSKRWWKKYLTRPRSSLFKREYDAIGIYAQARLGGVDIWKQAAPGLNAFDSEPAFNALAGTNESILDSWASGLLRDGARGSGWDLSSPGITGDKATPVSLAAVGNGGSAQLNAAKVTTNLATVSLEAYVIDITVDGHARLSLADKSNEVVHGTASWCLRSDKCACPDATDSGRRTVARGVRRSSP